MLINSPNISGSLKVTGNAVITGSLTVLGGINATITGSVTTASYVEYANVANKPALVSSSAQIVGYEIFATTGSNTFRGTQTISGSVQISGSLIMTGSVNISGSVTASFGYFNRGELYINNGSTSTAGTLYLGDGSITKAPGSGFTLSSLSVTGNSSFSAFIDMVAGSAATPQIKGSGGSTGIYWPNGATGTAIGFAFSSARMFETVGVTSGVNYLRVTQAITGSSPSLSAQGTDVNINLTLTPKGSGSVIISGSLTATGGITGSATSASYVEYTNVANKPTLISGSAQIAAFGYATTGSNQFNGSQAITGSLTVTGQVVAQTLNVQQVTSSIVYSSGSNIFGNTLGNTQQFTGSLQVTGSTHYVLGNVGVGTTTPSSSLHVTDGYVLIGIDKGVRFDSSGATGHPELSVDSGAALNFKNTSGGTNLTIANSGASTFASSATAGAFLTNAASGTAGQEAIRINNDNGYIGFFNGANNTRSGYIQGNTTDVTIATSPSTPLILATANAEKMRITSGGLVGIGTNNPASLLQVYGLGVTAANAVIQVTGTTNYAAYRMNNSGGDFYIGIENSGGTGFGTTAYGRVIFADGAYPLILFSAGIERMRITSGGNVGIGTTSPDAGLTVETNFTSFNALAVRSSNAFSTTPETAIAFRTKFNTAGAYSTNGLIIGYKDNATDGNQQGGLQFWTNAGSGVAEKIRITSAGRVGIGNTTPSNVVDIYDTSQNSPTVGILGARTRGGGTFITGRTVPRDTSNQTVTIATMSASGSNERIFIKVQVVNVSAVNNYGNVHVGYALWIGGGSSTVTTMTLDTGNSNIGNTSVGTLSWSGNNLQYTTNGIGNYELNSITIWGSARDTGVIT
jgi:hypothetical protein